MSTYRPACSEDYPQLITLQQYLFSPSPQLLQLVVKTQTIGSCLVSTTQTADIIGYALWLGGAEQSGLNTSALMRESTFNTNDGSDVDTDYMSMTNRKATAYLAELVIHPAYRRQRRGIQLLNALMTQLTPGTRLTLNVAVNNTPARKLYESAGFNPVRRREEFYRSETTDEISDVDAVIYAKLV